LKTKKAKDVKQLSFYDFLKRLYPKGITSDSEYSRNNIVSKACFVSVLKTKENKDAKQLGFLIL